MIITPSNLIYNDIVGLTVRVARSSDPTQQGLFGKVVDETANTLTVATDKGEKMIPKRNSSFSFYLPCEVTVNGDDIAFSPAERLKRLQWRRR
uniref:Ribonuclease P protein component 1 n=1 Tax=Candidatus Methanomethylicus mesodigestus TaxID=1867258 RepID=A0A7C3EW70_9CREN